MDWRTAFLLQARSDFAIFQRLNDSPTDYCHRLHYMQMATEKLAKSLLSPPHSDPPEASHAAFVRMLQVLKTRKDVRRQLGFRHTAAYRAYLDSLLELASRVERLAPSLAGPNEPNPEYPWRDSKTQDVIVPAQFAFDEFDLKNPKMLKLAALVGALLRIGA